MTEQARRGRIILIAIIVSYFLFEILISLLQMQSGLFAPGITLPRLALDIVLFYFLYAGRNWARWILGLLFGIGGLYATTMFFLLIFSSPAYFLLSLLLVFGLYCLICFGLLFFSPDVRAYRSYRSTPAPRTDPAA